MRSNILKISCLIAALLMVAANHSFAQCSNKDLKEIKRIVEIFNKNFEKKDYQTSMVNIEYLQKHTDWNCVLQVPEFKEMQLIHGRCLIYWDIKTPEKEKKDENYINSEYQQDFLNYRAAVNSEITNYLNNNKTQADAYLVKIFCNTSEPSNDKNLKVEAYNDLENNFRKIDSLHNYDEVLYSYVKKLYEIKTSHEKKYPSYNFDVNQGKNYEKSGLIDSAFFCHYINFKKKTVGYSSKETYWGQFLNDWRNLANATEVGGEQIIMKDEESIMFVYGESNLQLAYNFVKVNKFHEAIDRFLWSQSIPLSWLGNYNAAVLLSNLKLPAFIQEAKELFEYAQQKAPNDNAATDLFAKAEKYLNANKPIPVSMIEKKIFDDYLLIHKVETTDEYCRRNHTGKYKDNNSVATGTNDLGISESDFNQVVRITGEATRSVKNSNSMMESYNKKTEDGRFRTESPDNMNTVYMASREARDAISSLEKVNNILRGARTSDNSNKVNALINYNQEQIKTLSASLDKKKN